MSHQELKPTPCPRCQENIHFDKTTVIESIIKYNPIICPSCSGAFSFNPILVFIFLLLSIGLVFLAIAVNFYVPQLQKLEQIYPTFRVYALSTVFVATLATAFILQHFLPTLVQWKTGNLPRLVLHFLLLFLAFLGALLFAYTIINRI